MNFKKTAALAAAALLTCCVLTGCGGDGQSPEHPASTYPGEVRTTTFNITEPFQSIRVECGVSAVRLLPTPGDVAVGCTDLPGLRYSAQVEDGTLVVREEGKTTAQEAEILVCLPKPDYEALYISTGSGNVDATAGFRFTDVILTSDAGNLYLEQLLASGSMELNTGSGNVTLTGCDAASLTVNTGSGNVTGTLLTDKTFKVTSGSGNVNVPDTTGGDCVVTTGSGNVSLSIGGGV